MKPDFICIGAPKAGTTWLASQLKKHPHLWVPPVKELHYFDRRFPIEKVAEKKGIKKGFFGFYPSYNRKQLATNFGRALARWSLADTVWAHRYFSGELTDSWYASLFENRKEKVCGELTTDYCALSDEAVDYVSSLLPNVKIVFLLRNPVDRAWSHSRMLLPELLGKQLDDISEQEFIAYLTHPAARRKGEYQRTLDTWGVHFPSDQIFVGFYDDIQGQPEWLLKEVFQFLELDPGLADYSGLGRRVNAGRGSATIPPNVHSILIGDYRTELQGLNDRFGGHAEKWLESTTMPIA